MKAIHKENFPAVVLSCIFVSVLVACSATPPPQTQTNVQPPAQVQPQQVPIPKTASDVPGPVPGNTMTKEYVQFVGRMAYVWGYPLVNAHNRRVAFAQAPEPGYFGGLCPLPRWATTRC